MPLPVITGIGHDRDESVADIVANTALKTPTAVAQFIIDRAEHCERMVDEQVQRIKNSLRNYVQRRRANLERVEQKILSNMRLYIQRNQNKLDSTVRSIGMKMKGTINQRLLQIDNIAAKVEANNPENILRKGFSYTMHNGKPVLDANELTEGDTIKTVFYNGTAESTVTYTDNSK